jgi:hypothetical protein
MPMAKIGNFLFEADGTTFSGMDRESEYVWQSQKRLGLSPSRQYMGQGEDTVQITGTIYPHMSGGLGSINKLRALAKTGKPQVLSYTDEKQGQYMGKWAIDRIQENRSEFIKEGAPKKIEFTLSLARYNY